MNEQVIKLLPVSHLVESKTNPRTSFDQESLKEISVSIAERGLDKPLDVRPLGAGYEIVDGARRFRGAKMAGLTEIACIVQERSDEEVVETQAIDFLHKENLKPLEEVEALARLQKLNKWDVAMIAERTSKDRSHVTKMLQLVKLIPAGKALLEKENISVGGAVEICGLPEASQTKCVAMVKGQLWRDRNFVSQQTIHHFIEEDIYLDLSAASFKLSDEKLIPKAGACTVCPKNTQTTPDLFGTTKKGNGHCLDGKCFAEKCQATIAIKLKEAEDQGRTLIKIREKYENHAGAIGTQNYDRASGKQANAEGIMVDGLQAGSTIKIRLSDRQTGHSVGSRGSTPLSDSERKERYNRRMQIFHNKIEQDVRIRLLKEIFHRVKSVTEEDLRLIVRWALDGDFDKPLLTEMLDMKDLDREAMKGHQLMRVLLGIVLTDTETIKDPSFHHQPGDDNFAELVKRYDIDRKGLTKAVAVSMESMKPKPFKPTPKADKKKAQKKK